MKHYMLDTNTINYLLKGHTKISQRIADAPIASLCVSSITEGELLFGLAKRPNTNSLHKIVREFLLHVDVLPWDSAVAECYGHIRADMEHAGKVLDSLDMLIAAHSLHTNAVLVTNDKAFRHVPNLHLENWT